LESRTAFATGVSPFAGALASSQVGPILVPAASTPSQLAAFQGPTSDPAATAATASLFVAPAGGSTAPATGTTAAGGTLPAGSPLGNPAANPALPAGSNVSTGASFLAVGQVGNNPGSNLNPTGANLIVVALPSATGLGQPSTSSGSPVVVVQPQGTNLAPATLSPESLPLSSSAPLTVLDPANYLLARGLSPSLRAGNLPSLLVTQTTETVLEAGGNSGGGGQNAPNLGDGGVLPIDSGPLPDGQPQVPPQVLDAIRSLTSARPAASDADTTTDDHGPAAPEGATPLLEWQEVPRAEPLAVAASAGADW
jgi:hypothetical protein